MRRVHPILFFTLVVLLVFWKPIFQPEYTLLAGGDMCAQAFPWFSVAAHWLKKGILLLWDPYVYSGRPGLGELQQGILYPLNWIAQLIPAEGGGINLTALQGLLIVEYVLAAYFCYLLARSLGMNFAGSALAGVGYSTGGYSGQLPGWPHIFGSFVWMPLVIWAFRQAVLADSRRRRLKYLCAAAVFMALSLLAGHPAGAIHAGLLLLIWTVGFLFIRWRVTTTRSKVGIGLMLAALPVLAASLAAAQLFSSAEWSQHASRWIGAPRAYRGTEQIPYSVLEQSSVLSPPAAVSLVLPHLNARQSIYTGLPIVFLAVVGLLFARRREAMFFGAMAFGFFSVTWARLSVLHGWLYTFVPGMWFAREHYLFAAPLQLCLSLLAGYGLDHLMTAYAAEPERAFSVFLRRVGWAFALVVLLSGFLVVIAHLYRGVPMDDGFLLLAGNLGINSFILGVLIFFLYRRRIPPAWFAAAVLTLTVIDSSSVMSTDCHSVSEPISMNQHWRIPPAAQYLMSLRKTDVFRVEDPANILPVNFGDAWLLEETMGHGATCIIEYMNFRGADWSPSSNISALLNTKYVVSNVPMDGMEKVFEQDGAAVYHNSKAVPRAFAAASVLGFPKDEGMLAWIRSPLFSPRHTLAVSEGQLRQIPSPFLANVDQRKDPPVAEISFATAKEKQIRSAKDPNATEKLRISQAPWGWSNGDEISFAVRPSGSTQCFLNMYYYPAGPESSVVDVHVSTGAAETTLPVTLPGLPVVGAQASREMHMATDLTSLCKNGCRIWFQKSESCSAKINWVRVSGIPVRPEDTDEGNVEVTSLEPGRLRLHAELNRAAFVVVSEVSYPGWEARVDGKPALLLTGDYILQAVPVSAGTHEIELRFRPKVFRIGLWMSMLTLCAMLCALAL